MYITDAWSYGPYVMNVLYEIVFSWSAWTHVSVRSCWSHLLDKAFQICQLLQLDSSIGQRCFSLSVLQTPTSWSLCFSYECESASAITRSDCGLCLLPLVLILCHRDVTAKSGQIRDQPGNKNLKSVRTVKVIFDDFWYFWICLTESAPTASECQGQRDSHTSALETSRT